MNPHQDHPESKETDVAGSEGQNWLYSEKVKDHFFHPRNIFKTDAEVQEYEKTADGIGQVGSPACVPGNTLILTQNGFTEINKTEINNKVISSSGKFCNVTENKVRKYNGNLIEIQSKLGKLVYTPEHLIYSIKRPKERKYNYHRNRNNLAPEWNYAKNLKKNDFIIFPLLNIIQDKDFLEVDQTKKKWDFNSRSIPNKIKIDENILRLFGYFIAEGSTRKDNLRGDVIFTFNIKEEEYLNDVVSLIKTYFNLESKIIQSPKNNRSDVIVNNVHLANLFRSLFGSGAENKNIPNFILYLPFEKQKGLISGLWRGDGYINLTRKFPRAGYASISKLLISQLRIILLRQKIAYSIYSEKARSIKGVNHKPAYRIHVGDIDSLKKIVEIVQNKKLELNSRQKKSWFDYDYFYTTISGSKNINYDGNVYNLEVEEEHSYTTESSCIHNCGDVMRMFIKVDKNNNTLKECKWRTFGCASAIASTSILSEMVIGMNLEEAKKITPNDIVKALGGLPARKIHCSVLGDQALRAAIKDYEDKKK